MAPSKCWRVLTFLVNGTCIRMLVILFLGANLPDGRYMRVYARLPSVQTTARNGTVHLPAESLLAVFQDISPAKCFANCLSHPECVSWTYVYEESQGKSLTTSFCRIHNMASDSVIKPIHLLEVEDSIRYDLHWHDHPSSFGTSCAPKPDETWLNLTFNFDEDMSYSDGLEPTDTFRDCNDVDAFYGGQGAATIFAFIKPDGFDEEIEVMCVGGWIVFQFRHDGNDSFLRDWDDYRLGFTSPHGSILWLGNENLHRLTSSGSWVLGVLLVDWADEARSSFYWNFRVSDESQGYRLNIDSYLSIDGDAGDSLSMHNGAKFSTWDKDNDVSDVNCASLYSGGWWFTDCLDSNLNGEYFGTGNHTSALTNQGIIWSSWKGRHYSVRQTMMFLINNGSEVFV